MGFIYNSVLIDFFGHLRATQQPINTTLTYWLIKLICGTSIEHFNSYVFPHAG